MMKIALISYEYPPETAYGGIATYVQQAAQMLCRRGHHVEVFCASTTAESSKEIDGILVHRVLETDIVRFADSVAPLFVARHHQVGFDVMEGPEYMADARTAASHAPDVGLVVKLHTPSFMLERMERTGESPKYQLKHKLQAALRGTRPTWHHLHKRHRLERLHTLAADCVAAPSRSVADLVKKCWSVPESRICCFPYPYAPSPALLQIPVQSDTRCVTYFGRLEMRKGVLHLARAIPKVLERHPDTVFRFVGRALDSPEPKMLMDQYLRRMLQPFAASVRIEAPVTLAEIPSMLAGSDICVFPSVWESFGLVCLEALSAARGVVCSSGCGLEELIGFGKFGISVPARQPQRLADGINQLLDNPEMRMQLGQTGRTHVCTTYCDERVGVQQEACYERAIETAHRRVNRLKGAMPSRRKPVLAGT